jgi:hypothetical protein
VLSTLKPTDLASATAMRDKAALARAPLKDKAPALAAARPGL